MSNTHTPQRRVNICCGCRRSRLIWKSVCVCEPFHRSNHQLQHTAENDFQAKLKRSPWCLVFFQQRWNSTNQTRCHIQMYSNSIWLCIVHLFLLNTTGATWITLVLGEWTLNTGGNNDWKVSGAKISADLSNSPTYKPAASLMISMKKNCWLLCAPLLASVSEQAARVTKLSCKEVSKQSHEGDSDHTVKAGIWKDSTIFFLWMKYTTVLS